ncbi:MAG TPA: BTAD domain-containing putative transcriptional regulator [Longimicrobium sp.]|nr:BTAD domain-containing putative transcriptional regulator [Longimicrobium sp.]
MGRERIIALLWPDAEPADARHSLVESLSVIRRELGEDPFVCVGDEVAIDPARLACDVEEFRRAEAADDADAAVALYAGPFLDGFVVKDAPEFERWAEEVRAYLASRFAHVLEAEAARREAVGDRRAAVQAWRRLAAQERYSTRVALRLAAALEAVGDPAAALQHLAIHETLLREELELPAPPELAAALEALRRCAAYRPVSPPPAAAPPAEQPPPGSEIVRHHDSVDPPTHSGPSTTVWLAALAALDRLRTEAPSTGARAQAQLGVLARRAAEHAGGMLDGVVGDAVLARFASSRAAAAAAVTLLGRWDAWCAREGLMVELMIGMDRGSRVAPDDRIPDEATRRASVLRTRAEPGSIVTTAAVAREAGMFAGVTSAPCGAASLPGTAEPELLMCLSVRRRRHTRRGGTGKAQIHPRLARRGLPSARLGALAAAVVLCAVVWLLAIQPQDTEPDEIGVEPRSLVAIVGCDAPAGADALRAACDVTMDLLAVALSRVPKIGVVRPLTGAEGRPYWPAGAALDTVARRVGGLLALSARVEESGGRYRLVLFLSDPLSGVVVDADTLETSESGFRLEETLSDRASTLLRRRLGMHGTVQRAGRGTRSAEARRWFTRARLLRYAAVDSLALADDLRTALSMRDLAYADSLLMRAERADSRWLEPVLERGWIALLQGNATPLEERHAHWRRALQHAERAVAMQSDNAGAYELRARARWELTEAATYADSAERMVSYALQDLQRALKLDEERASALYALSQLQYYRGDFTGSLHSAEQAYRVDPYLEGGMALQERRFRSALSMGRLDVASTHCRDGARNYPRVWRFVECELLLAARGAGPADTVAAASVRRRLEAAVPPEKSDSVGLDYQPIHWQVLHAAVLARAGAAARARRELGEARRRTQDRLDAAARRGARSDDNWISFRFDEAQVLQLLGDSTGARQALADIGRRRPHHRAFIRNEAVFRGLFR